MPRMTVLYKLQEEDRLGYGKERASGGLDYAEGSDASDGNRLTGHRKLIKS